MAAAPWGSAGGGVRLPALGAQTRRPVRSRRCVGSFGLLQHALYRCDSCAGRGASIIGVPDEMSSRRRPVWGSVFG